MVTIERALRDQSPAAVTLGIAGLAYDIIYALPQRKAHDGINEASKRAEQLKNYGRR